MTSCLQKVGIWMHYRDPTGIRKDQNFLGSASLRPQVVLSSLIHMYVLEQYSHMYNSSTRPYYRWLPPRSAWGSRNRKSIDVFSVKSHYFSSFDLSLFYVFVRWKQIQDRSREAWLQYMEQQGKCRTEVWWMSSWLVSWIVSIKVCFWGQSIIVFCHNFSCKDLCTLHHNLHIISNSVCYITHSKERKMINQICIQKVSLLELEHACPLGFSPRSRLFR